MLRNSCDGVQNKLIETEQFGDGLEDSESVKGTCGGVGGRLYLKLIFVV